MKLILQIALGVFLGALTAQLTLDAWHTHQDGIAKAEADKLRTAQERVRLEQGERIRALLLQGRQGNTPAPGKPPAGFVPDDIDVETRKEK